MNTFALIILDGFGFRESAEDNAIKAANMPHFDHYWSTYASGLIAGSGEEVGLPEGQMGNSEVGHLNMGAGRIMYQEFTRIQHAIKDGSFYQNEVLLHAIHTAVNNKKAIHILGLLSPGGIHSHEDQIKALLQLIAKEAPALSKQTYLHAFLDGRDTPPRSALASLQKFQKIFKDLSCGQFASIIGRYYAMDRDKRWERIQAAYELLTEGKAAHETISAIAGLEAAYERGETDEFVKATSIHSENNNPVRIEDGDVVIFMNYRADRAREITRALLLDDFLEFQRHRKLKLSAFVSLTQYAKDLPTQIAFPPQMPSNTLGEYFAKCGKRQLRIAETEKYAHVTFFFNGGIEQPFSGEDRILIPSPKIATYDLQPEMSAIALTDKLVDAILNQQYSLIICNFANPDMVGHTGNFEATVKAVEVIDNCLGRIVEALHQVHGEAIITADHGNAEKMYDKELQQPHTAHTHEPVPFIYIGRAAKFIAKHGSLADIAPTILHLLNLPKPAEMTGQPLIELTKII